MTIKTNGDPYSTQATVCLSLLGSVKGVRRYTFIFKKRHWKRRVQNIWTVEDNEAEQFPRD